MGLLVEGVALSPEETAKVGAYIREHGITQFLNTWRRVKDIHDDELRFGDEIECGIFVINGLEKTVKLSIRGAEIRKILSEKEIENLHQVESCTWHPEFGAWMVESTPGKPYSNYANDLLRVEKNMIIRRRRLLSVLNKNEIAPTTTCFPLLGVGDFIHNAAAFSSPHSLSVNVPDYVINPHPRFPAMTENIRARRGMKVDIRVPLYQDLRTPEFLKAESTSIGGEPEIHMDCMAFGMGMCCLQVTFQARDVDESRYMYDQLAVLAPIMLAMTAATPIFQGRLADVDARWSVIAQSVDDRTPAERGLVLPKDGEMSVNPNLAGGGLRRIPKSRYDSISAYIYHCSGDPACTRTFEIYNDIPCPYDEEIKQRLLGEGLDVNLAHHLAHLFIRDPLVVYFDKIEVDDERSTDHFENIQSTNWNTCRWKPPPPRNSPDDPHIGWRTEFRSMEVQMTDFENAAFTVFVVLVTRVLLAFDLAFYIPLSKVDENMRRAQVRDGLNQHKFYFRKHLAPPANVSPNESSKSSPSPCSGAAASAASGSDNSASASSSSEIPISAALLNSHDSFEEMSMDEIFNGKDLYFPGLIPLVYAYLDYINCDPETFNRIDQYLSFISKRAKGELLTPASWIRSFVHSHPAYAQDSVISQEIAFDLLVACQSIGDGSKRCPELLGDIVIDRVRSEDAYGQKLAGRLTTAERSALIERLVQRAGAERSSGSSTPARGRLPSFR